MLIRSQDKKSIINLNQIDTIMIKKSRSKTSNIQYFNGGGDSMGCIAKYSTEEKAIKVLDMIQDAYKDYRGGNVYEHSVFQMPQDSEV